jgi:uncharacterized protein (DUF486 family)
MAAVQFLQSLPVSVQTIGLMMLSNIFMTFAWWVRFTLFFVRAKTSACSLARGGLQRAAISISLQWV